MSGQTSLVKQQPLLFLCIWNPANPQATASGKGIRSLLFFKCNAEVQQSQPALKGVYGLLPSSLLKSNIQTRNNKEMWNNSPPMPLC